MKGFPFKLGMAFRPILRCEKKAFLQKRKAFHFWATGGQLPNIPSLHRNRLSQIPRLIHIRPARQRRVIRQQLQRHHVQNR